MRLATRGSPGRTSNSGAATTVRRRSCARARSVSTRGCVSRSKRFAASCRRCISALRALQAANEATRTTLLRLEAAYTRAARACAPRSPRRAGSTRWPTRRSSSAGFEAPPADLDDPARANEVLRAVALLVRALPRAARASRSSGQPASPGASPSRAFTSAVSVSLYGVGTAARRPAATTAPLMKSTSVGAPARRS